MRSCKLWSSDGSTTCGQANIGYVPMRRIRVPGDDSGLGTRKVLRWLSNTLTRRLLRRGAAENSCALSQAGDLEGRPRLAVHERRLCCRTRLARPRIGVDGPGAWPGNNIFVERLWRTISYEEIYLHAYDSVSEAHAAWFGVPPKAWNAYRRMCKVFCWLSTSCGSMNSNRVTYRLAHAAFRNPCAGR